MRGQETPIRIRLALAVGLAVCGATSGAGAGSFDPLASNNLVYPSAAEWSGEYRPANLNYPTSPVPPPMEPGFGRGAITLQNAAAYMSDLKEILVPTIGNLVNAPNDWTPAENGWYDMPWMAQGTALSDGRIDPTSGREAIQGSYTGQALERATFTDPQPAVRFQNYAVIYYNGTAAAMLGRLWRNLYEPDLSQARFPEGSIVVKVGSATLTPQQWPPLEGSSLGYVYRPSMKTLLDPNKTYKTPEVVPLRFSQMAIAVKDSVASPQTGWVYMAFTYDTNAEGVTVWDRTVPVGAMWGNDPEAARVPSGLPPDGKLKETWLNLDAPAFTHQTLGWGGRLAGPMDVATRHGVFTVSGKDYGQDPFPASSCLSCHGAAQYPMVANLYASPNTHFPTDGDPFLFYDPGSEDWANWFQNLPGDEPMSGAGRQGLVGLDYDLLLLFAVMGANAAIGNDAFALSPLPHVH